MSIILSYDKGGFAPADAQTRSNNKGIVTLTGKLRHLGGFGDGVKMLGIFAGCPKKIYAYAVLGFYILGLIVVQPTVIIRDNDTLVAACNIIDIWTGRSRSGGKCRILSL